MLMVGAVRRKSPQRLLVMLGTASLLESSVPRISAFHSMGGGAAAAAIFGTSPPPHVGIGRSGGSCRACAAPASTMMLLRRQLQSTSTTVLDDAVGGSEESWETVEHRSDGESCNASINDGVAAETKEEPLEDPLLSEYRRWFKAVERAETTLLRKQTSLQNELKKAEKVELITARANLLKTYIYVFSPGITSATVQDWEQDGKEVELTLDSNFDSAASEVDSLFTEIRKLKRGSQVVSELLQQNGAAVYSLCALKKDFCAAEQQQPGGGGAYIDANVLRLVQDRLIRSARSTSFSPPPASEDDEQRQGSNKKNSRKKNRKPELGTPASNVRKLQSEAGCTILVGRNRRGNEHLSLSVAKGDDVWMHARGSPGAHVLVLQPRNGPVATEACLQLAADLAAFYSDARVERRVEVTAAKPKHVQKPRGAPLGAVKLRQELKVYTGNPGDVPESLKEARRVSGLSDEYRAADKAKLRKQNQLQALKQKQAKRHAKKAKQKEQQQTESFY